MATNDLAPGFLLAAPRLGDPNFERTVVLLGRHGPDGALGWVLNGKPVRPVGELLRDSKLLAPGAQLPATPSFAELARVGGPVASETGWIVYRRVPDVTVAGEIEVGPSLGVSSAAEALEALVRGEGPREFRLLVGYAGWAPGQLEGEVRAGAWLPAPLVADLVFDTPADELWTAAYQGAIGAAPGAFMSTRRGLA